MKRIPVLLLIIWSVCQARAQSGIKGVTAGAQPDSRLSFATVVLSGPVDTPMRKITDRSGAFFFNDLPKGVYSLKITYIGFEPLVLDSVTIAADSVMDIGIVQLRPQAGTLSQAVVTAKKPLIERSSDRFTVNVENSPLAAGDAYKILASAPFVRVSPTKEITLQDKKTLVLVDGKPVTGDALQNILENLTARDIIRIDLITDPSAKYDAGYGAVIDLITRKKTETGYSANLYTEGSYGKYGIYTARGKLTYKTKRVTFYAGGGFRRYNEWYYDQDTRQLTGSGKVSVLQDSTIRLYHSNISSFQAGADIQLGKTQTLGFMAEGIFRTTPNGIFNTATKFSQQAMPLDSVLVSPGSFVYHGSTYNTNVNYRLLADSGRTELTGLITYTPLTRHIIQGFSPTLLNGKNSVIDVPAPYDVSNSADIDITVGQADFTHAFAHSWKLESGVKYQRTVTNSDVVQQTDNNGTYLTDSSYSFNSKMTEAITAGYAIVSKKYKKDVLQAGLRVENTNAASPGNFAEKYTDLFPNISWQHTLARKLNFSLGYKRQINRPPYQEMLPYSIILDEYTILQGNPLLRPSYSQVATLNLDVRKLNVSLNYTYTTGAFSRLPIKEDTGTQATYYATQNIDNTGYWNLNIFYPLKVTRWWTANTSAHGGFATSTGTVLGVRETRSSFNANFSSYQEFSLSKTIQAEAGYYWYSKQTTNLITTNAYGNINAGITAKVLKGKGTIGLNVYELLKRTTYRSFQQFGAFESTTASQSDSRRVYLSFTLNFGKTKVNLADKKLGNEDAIKRTH